MGTIKRSTKPTKKFQIIYSEGFSSCVQGEVSKF